MNRRTFTTTLAALVAAPFAWLPNGSKPAATSVAEVAPFTPWSFFQGRQWLGMEVTINKGMHKDAKFPWHIRLRYAGTEKHPNEMSRMMIADKDGRNEMFAAFRQHMKALEARGLVS